METDFYRQSRRKFKKFKESNAIRRRRGAGKRNPLEDKRQEVDITFKHDAQSEGEKVEEKKSNFVFINESPTSFPF